ncbi:MAG: DUF4912 domain-containing protein [Candidatus Udaeobacter sp.]
MNSFLLPDFHIARQSQLAFNWFAHVLARMVKGKTKRNAGRLPANGGFQIRQGPMVHLAGHPSQPDVDDRIAPTSMCGQPFLFAIARDPRTIFVSWNIDWRFVFEKAMPAHREVHLQVIDGEGGVETRVAVEPMSGMHYVTISGLHNSYRVEIGYFQVFDTWHSVAMSSEIEMPPQGSVGFADVDLATIPFHLSFQKLANFFGVANDTSVARVVSEFQKRVLSGHKPNEAIPSDTRILRNLNLSLPEIGAAQRDFKKIDTEKLARRARAMISIRRDQSSAWIRSESSWS